MRSIIDRVKSNEIGSIELPVFDKLLDDRYVSYNASAAAATSVRRGRLGFRPPSGRARAAGAVRSEWRAPPALRLPVMATLSAAEDEPPLGSVIST